MADDFLLSVSHLPSSSVLTTEEVVAGCQIAGVFFTWAQKFTFERLESQMVVTWLVYWDSRKYFISQKYFILHHRLLNIHIHTHSHSSISYESR